MKKRTDQKYNRTVLLAVLSILFLAAAAPLRASVINDVLTGKVAGLDAAADQYEYVGSNLIANGHVVMRFKGISLTADKAIININSEDLELIGNVSLSMNSEVQKEVTLKEYEKLMEDPYNQTTIAEYVTTDTGEQKLKVKTVSIAQMIKAERATGNLRTGTLMFKNFALKSDMVYCTGKKAERMFNGEITVWNAKFTTCEYLMDGHDHYAVGAQKAIITPRKYNRGIFNYNPDQGEHSILALNNTLQLYGIPIVWLPVVYKPRDLSTFGIRMEFGKTKELGFFFRSNKNFQILDEPFLNADLMLDFYEKRGLAYGVSTDLLTPESSTEVFFYGLNDKNPYEYWDKETKSSSIKNHLRMEIPHYRYEVRVANMTHITPHLDFRGQFDKISDFQFLDDYFKNRYDSELEPPTFASLEYQHERFTASVYANVRVNNFFTTAERLPSMRLDFQRQELFANLYYQGQTSADFLYMKWREYDEPLRDKKGQIIPDSELKNYHTFRFDTLHMFYYPLQFFNINIIPRAGFRLTAYSQTSDKEVNYEDLASNFYGLDSLESQYVNPAVNYDGKGGSKLRFVAEFGVELNTKIYRSWQNVKSAYWQLDGLRHVIVPYVNYTYIPKPTEDCDNLYYFDEIDRISEQNFIRMGLVNRLQTRRENKIYEWMSFEVYWDYFFHKEKGFNEFGDVGLIFNFNPTKDITFTSQAILDVGRNNDHDYEVKRGGRVAGRPGLNWDFLNYWENKLTWSFAPGWKLSGSYIYSDAYYQRMPYSMSGSFTTIRASSLFTAGFTRSQKLKGELQFPVYFDKHMKGSISCTYDVDDALMSDANISITRQFHCWDVTLTGGKTVERNGSDNDKEDKFYFAVYAALHAMPSIGFGQKNQ